MRPDAFRRGTGDEAVLELPSGPHTYLLTLAVGRIGEYSTYRLEIVRSGTEGIEPLWAKSGLERQGDGTFELYLPGDFLSPGRYELRLYGLAGSARKRLATYTFEV